MMIHVLFGVALSLCVIGLVVFRIHKGKSPGVMNIILLISAILLAWFTVTMIQLFPGVWHDPRHPGELRLHGPCRGSRQSWGGSRPTKKNTGIGAGRRKTRRQMEEAAKQVAVDPAKEEKNNL